MDDVTRYYAILGVQPGAPPEQVKRAYRRLMKRWHPDLFPRHSEQRRKAEGRAKQINEAYARLRADKPRSHPRTGRAPTPPPHRDAPREGHRDRPRTAPSPGAPAPTPRRCLPPVAHVSWLLLLWLLLRIHPFLPQIAMSPPCFGVGATQASVLGIQGRPSARDPHVWWYGTSRVYFVAGRVIAWASTPEDRLRAGLLGCTPMDSPPDPR